MLRRTQYTSKRRFLSRLNLVMKNGCLECWYKVELKGITYYVLEYLN